MLPGSGCGHVSAGSAYNLGPATSSATVPGHGHRLRPQRLFDCDNERAARFLLQDLDQSEFPSANNSICRRSDSCGIVFEMIENASYRVPSMLTFPCMLPARRVTKRWLARKACMVRLGILLQSNGREVVITEEPEESKHCSISTRLGNPLPTGSSRCGGGCPLPRS